MLEKYLNKLLKNKNYSFDLMKINYIKENDDFYVVYFIRDVESIGLPLTYKINKSNGENEAVFLPDENNFKFLKEFENCDFVNIPEKFKGKYFR